MPEADWMRLVICLAAIFVTGVVLVSALVAIDNRIKLRILEKQERNNNLYKAMEGYANGDHKHPEDR